MYYTYQLIHIPPANGHVALVIIHALSERPNIVLARRRLSPAAGGAVALVETVVHLLGGGGWGCLLRLSWGAGATAEETTEGMADGRADGDTAGCGIAVSLFSRPTFSSHMAGHLRYMYCTYAAVEAIWPKRPDPALCWAGGAWVAGG